MSFLTTWEGRPVAFKDAAKFIPTLSAQHTGRIIKAAQERGYLTQSPNIEMTDKSKLIIGEVCTQAMDGFSKEFGVSFGLSDQRA